MIRVAESWWFLMLAAVVAAALLASCAASGTVEMSAALARIESIETKLIEATVTATAQTGDISAIKTGDSEGVTTWMLAAGLIATLLASTPCGALLYQHVLRPLRKARELTGSKGAAP